LLIDFSLLTSELRRKMAFPLSFSFPFPFVMCFPFGRYRWTKDGEQFDPEEVRGIKQLENSGTLIIHANNGNVPTRFNGLYRCYASNILGTAVSSESRIIVENAPQWPKEEVAPITAEEGTHTVLPCNPPTSADPPKIYWLNSKIEHITQDERVTVGQDGNLYFANVQMKDSQPDYICNAHFQGPRLIIQKEPIELKVIPTNTFSYQKPILIVPETTRKSYVALLGKPLILECIAAGLPTPTVEWIHLNRLNPSPGVTFENYNKTLCIPSVTEDDDGDYQCIARNEHGSIYHTYTVNVEAAPQWIKMPVSQIYGPGENVRLDCEVDGKPKPKVSWSINGIPLKGKRKIQSGALIFSEVQPNDTAVIQCQAHNKHGSILANAYILVVWLPAEILTPDGIEYAVVENQIVILHCKTFGAPRPKVQWFMEDMNPALKDERIFIFTNGSLKLQEVRQEDAGNFTCLAENDQNNVSITAHLVVKRATQIEEGPINMEKKQGESVTFYCKVLFDESIPKRGIQWRLDGEDIEESDNNNKYIIGDMSLKVTNVDFSDQGTYSCLAWTTLDSVEKSANLLVYGKPGPVSNLELQRHGVFFSHLNFSLTEYNVFCEETKFGPEQMEWLATVPGNQPWAILHLAPFRSYNFYVQASNDQGKSELSSRSASYATDPAAPERNPTDVRGEGNETTNMIITWTPLPHKEWNAPMIKYHVQWRLENEGQWDEVEIEDPPVLVTDTPVFSPYEIKVQAVNDFGKGPEPESKKGYSGEDVPEAVPEDLLIEMINSTTIKLSWILPDKEKILGHLKGFKVYYSRLGTLAERSRRQAHLHFHPHGELLILGNVSEVILGGLRPWSRYQVQLAVLNGRGEGPRSEAMEFVTPEGVPSIPESFQLNSLSDTAVLLEWMPPKYPNGRLLRYVLGYQQGESVAALGFSGVCSTASWESGEENPHSHFIFSYVAFDHLLFPTVQERQKSFAAEGWFIGFISAIVLLILVLVLLCFIKRSKGGKYSVKDKEDTQVDSEARPMKDETFGEYSDNEEKPFTSSQPSLNGDIKALGSDDSLADYGGSVDVQFNEDGSFIGQYSGQKGKEGGGNDSSGATSPTNVVAALE
uniref:L1 cell adhesion molecule n=1 Tax=Pseudonaja textilis TaxID=8673 RepID=A0A670Y4A0_PSETE